MSAAAPDVRLLIECPLGVRFKYLLEDYSMVISADARATYVLLSREDAGIVAKWDGIGHNAPVAGQGIYSADDTREEFRALRVEVIE